MHLKNHQNFVRFRLVMTSSFEAGSSIQEACSSGIRCKKLKKKIKKQKKTQNNSTTNDFW